jgi:LysR family transcriptional regulator, regulator for bpeEF and oprC
MTLEQLRVLVKVVEAGSFTRAAEVLGSPRSQVSRVIAQLERDLGVTLLERTTRTMSVSEAGRAVHERALSVLATLDDTRRVLAQAQAEPRGLLRVTCSVEFGIAVVGAWLEEFLERHPQVTAEVEYASREIDLVHEGFDLAIRSGPLPDSSLVARPLGELTHGLYASPAYLRARGRPRRPADLAGHQLVLFSGAGPRASWTLQHGSERETLKVAPLARLRVNTGASVRSALLRGLGIGQLPNVVAAEWVRSGALAPVLMPWRPAPVPVLAVYPSHRYLTPKVKAFVELAMARFPGPARP